jgi:hypothetical protein
MYVLSPPYLFPVYWRLSTITCPMSSGLIWRPSNHISTILQPSSRHHLSIDQTFLCLASVTQPSICPSFFLSSFIPQYTVSASINHPLITQSINSAVNNYLSIFLNPYILRLYNSCLSFVFRTSNTTALCGCGTILFLNCWQLHLFIDGSTNVTTLNAV